MPQHFNKLFFENMRVHLTEVIVSAILLASASDAALAQSYSQPPVSISKEKVTNGDGKIYYSHTVLEKQTLYSIAKAYGVTPDEICTANQDLHIRENGIKKGSVILIPCKTISSGSGNAAHAADTIPATPAKSPISKTDAASSQDDGEYFVHTAKWYEDLYDLAKKYSVPADVLKEYNGMSSYKLKSRQKVRIPLKYSSSDESLMVLAKDEDRSRAENPTTARNADRTTDKTAERAAEKTSGEDADPVGNQDEKRISTFEIRLGGKVNAALMLPFGASAGADAGYMDFYSGVLLAAEDIRKEGTDIDLRIYDSAGDAMPMTAERFEQEDVVIGPVKSAKMERLLSLPSGRAVAVSPLDQSTAELLDRHHNLLQAPASMAVQYGDLLNWLVSESKPGDKFIVISEKGAQPTSSAMLMDQTISEYGLQAERFSYTILEGRAAVGHLTNMLTDSHTNRLIINSDNEAFVNDAVRNLAMMAYRKFDVVLYSPSKIRSYETIDVENLHNLKTRVATPYYIDYDNRKVTDFLYRYRALFGTEPTQFSFQGYDIAYYMFSLISRYGDGWIGKLETDDIAMMQTDFKFRRSSPDSGLLNHGIRRVIYNPDLTISLID